MTVLDASILIAHLDDADALHSRAGDVLREVIEDGVGASPLTMAEVLVGPTRMGRLERARGALRELGVAAIGMREEAPVRLAMLRVATRLRLPDCCVLLAAEQIDGGVATLDQRLGSAARELGLVVRG